MSISNKCILWLNKKIYRKGLNESIIRKLIEIVDHLDRSLLLKHCKPKRKDSIPFSLKYNPVLLNNKQKIISKHWHILSINSSFKELFNNIQPMIAFLWGGGQKIFILRGDPVTYPAGFLSWYTGMSTQTLAPLKIKKLFKYCL